ncbi:MAG: M15 family metallopeptidase, partial [Lachnospiraceae bacterium]|nr:M15 family metallopeptidase [Lachnospiraceae bacterium]
GNGRKCDARIADNIKALFEAAKREGLSLYLCSPYRDLDRQNMLFDKKIKNYMGRGMSYAEAYIKVATAVTVPGCSEHQVGLAFDITSTTYTVLDSGFGNTDEGKWLEENCARFGFILRYPKGKERITGIEYEPWHFRYVGEEAAAVIMEKGITLEEFWEEYLK